MQIMTSNHKKTGKIIVNDTTIYYDGRAYDIPRHVNGEFRNVRSLCGRRFFINGWEFKPKTGKFKRTIRAWWECYILPIFM